jgi:hypothetical protein
MISSIIPVSFVGSKWTGLSAARLRWGGGFKEKIREGTEIRSKKYFRRGISAFLLSLVADEPFGSPLVMIGWLFLNRFLGMTAFLMPRKKTYKVSFFNKFFNRRV